MPINVKFIIIRILTAIDLNKLQNRIKTDSKAKNCNYLILIHKT